MAYEFISQNILTHLQLLCRNLKILDAAVRCINGGSEIEVKLVCWRADMARSKLFLGGNRLPRH